MTKEELKSCLASLSLEEKQSDDTNCWADL
ncbi:MAG: hypothetical protein PWP24_860 [Clostridiales bacterium]|nr:hypothetical protein [Clostridiales bacterium]